MEKKDIKVLVITGFGLNCENETAAACRLAGATPELVHLNDLIDGQCSLDDFHMLCFIGGFSYGDHLGSGTVFGNRVKFKLHDQLKKFIADGKLIIGICNGFQTITKLGLVPALNGEYFVQSVALTHNDSGVFRDDWCVLKVDAASPCVFTKGIKQIRLPLRHGEGKFYAENAMLDYLEYKHMVVVKYIDMTGNPTMQFPENPNGSLRAIAGICDETGRIFGLMPHPEAFLSPYNAPDWSAKQAVGEKLPETGEGAQIFINAINYIADNF